MIRNIFPQKSVFREGNSLITIMQLINPNYCILENLGSNRLTLPKTNCCKGVFFGFLLPLAIFLSEFNLFNNYFS